MVSASARWASPALTGPPRPNINKHDNLLRRFSFFNDWRTGRAVAPPQAARLVEVLVRPQTDFRNALMADVQIDLSNQDVLIDSYDSSKGNYDSTTNHGTLGNIATNGKLINANHATVKGNALTNNGTVKAGDNVTGQQSSNFYQELPPLTAGMLNPALEQRQERRHADHQRHLHRQPRPVQPDPRAARRHQPARRRASHQLHRARRQRHGTGAAPRRRSYIKVYVQGDVSTTGSSYINLAAGVNAIFYVTGNVNLQGNGILNNSYLPSHLVLNGIQPTPNADGTTPARTITIATAQDFQGIVYAPNHDLDLALQAVPRQQRHPRAHRRPDRSRSRDQHLKTSRKPGQEF